MNDKTDPPSKLGKQQKKGEPPSNASDDSPALPLADRPRRRTSTTRPAPLYDTIESAAAKLGLDVEALRARCRRAAVRVGDTIQAHLGGGIVAFKFGRSWRVLFPSA